jgi:hypothetical protein
MFAFISLSTMSALQFKLINNDYLMGELVGKQADTIYIKTDSTLVSCRLNYVNSIKSFSGSPNLLNKVIEKKDWKDNGYNYPAALEYKIYLVSNPKMDHEESKAYMNSLSDRELQIYLTELQIKENQKNADNIRKTVWKVYLTTIAIGVVAVVISAILAK